MPETTALDQPATDLIDVLDHVQHVAESLAGPLEEMAHNCRYIERRISERKRAMWDSSTAVLRHPDWCAGPNWCEAKIDAEGDLVGQHYGGCRTMPTVYGVDIYIGLSAEVRGENSPHIAVRLSDTDLDDDATSEERWPFAGQIWLEPEEAEHLARRLLDAAAEWRAARRDHQESE